eukprot:6207386-Pleurochrysis_carterae.AAC.2
MPHSPNARAAPSGDRQAQTTDTPDATPTAPRRAWWRQQGTGGRSAPRRRNAGSAASLTAPGAQPLTMAGVGRGETGGGRARERGQREPRAIAILGRAAGNTRTALADRVSARAAELGLTGVLGASRDDEWLRGEPTAEQARRVEALRASFQARAREAADNRRLSTALDRWAEFL